MTTVKTVNFTILETEFMTESFPKSVFVLCVARYRELNKKRLKNHTFRGAFFSIGLQLPLAPLIFEKMKHLGRAGSSVHFRAVSFVNGLFPNVYAVSL